MKTKAYLFSIIFYVFFLHLIFILAAGAANRIMPLGDSITNGNSSGIVPDLTAYYVSYRKALYDKLKADGYVLNDEIFVGTLISGASVAEFDPDHNGHRGWRDDEIVNGEDIPQGEGKLDEWLIAKEPNIVLLHIGTNGLDTSPDDVADILDEIETYEIANSVTIWVILARIINRNCSTLSTPCSQSGTTMDFNDNVEDMALDRINNPDNPAFPDKIVIVDMEAGAGIDYRLQPIGDMWDNLHPFETGYAKMADLWFAGLMDIMPQANAGGTRTVKETATVTLNGSDSSDPDGTIASYLWAQTAGPQVTLSDETAARPTFTAPNVDPNGETLIFKLTVTDNDGLEATDTVSIDVINTINPVADAGDDQNVTEGDPVAFDGTGSSDADGTIVSYAWTQTAGTPVNLTGAGTSTAAFTAPNVAATGEILTFQLKVTDDDNLEAADTVRIEVSLKDSCLNDPNKIEPGICGCGIADVDTDGDNTFDCVDENFDNDGVPDIAEQGPAGNDPNYDGNDDGVGSGADGTDSSGGGGGGGGCFISTAGYGFSGSSATLILILLLGFILIGLSVPKLRMNPEK